MSQQTVTINGVIYDKHTGLPLRKERGAVARPSGATAMHTQLQHSRTLNRRYVKKDNPLQPAKAPAQKHAIKVRTVRQPQAAVSSDANPSINRFTPRTPKPGVTPVTSDIGPVKHAMVERAQAKQQPAPKPLQKAAPKPAYKPSDILKREAIEEATAKMSNKKSNKRTKAAKRQNPFSRALSVASGALALVLMGGYLTYISMPNISTRVAASQAGVNAHYPSYHPTGYSLSGPVAYQQGEVAMKFTANAGPQSYTLKQTNSNWDSAAVLDNYVEPLTRGDYVTSQVNGLTVYTFENQAAWVNGGVLYTITGDARLSSDQIQRIATSL